LNFYHAQIDDCLDVLFFFFGEEFFNGFLARSVGAKKVDGIFVRVILREAERRRILCNAGRSFLLRRQDDTPFVQDDTFLPGFFFGFANIRFHAKIVQQIDSDLIKGDHVALFVQLREKDVARFAHNGGHQA